MCGGAARVILSLAVASLLAACAGSTLPNVIEQTQDGVIALVQNDVKASRDGLIVMNTIERHGFVRRQGSCLIVDHGGQEYSPVFRARETFRSALKFANGQASTPLELYGDPLPRARRGFSEELTSFCSRPLFLLVGIAPSGFPDDPPVPGRP